MAGSCLRRGGSAGSSWVPRDGRLYGVAGVRQAGIGQEPFHWVYAMHPCRATEQGAGEEGEVRGPA